MRGQLLYATPDLRQRTGVPADFDVSDEVAVAQMERLVPLDTMRDRASSSSGTSPAASNSEPNDEPDGKVSRCFSPFLSMFSVALHTTHMVLLCGMVFQFRVCVHQSAKCAGAPQAAERWLPKLSSLPGGGCPCCGRFSSARRCSSGVTQR